MRTGVSPSRSFCAARDTPVPNAIAFTTGTLQRSRREADAPSTAPPIRSADVTSRSTRSTSTAASTTASRAASSSGIASSCSALAVSRSSRSVRVERDERRREHRDEHRDDRRRDDREDVTGRHGHPWRCYLPASSLRFLSIGC